MQLNVEIIAGSMIDLEEQWLVVLIDDEEVVQRRLFLLLPFFLHVNYYLSNYRFVWIEIKYSHHFLLSKMSISFKSQYKVPTYATMNRLIIHSG